MKKSVYYYFAVIGIMYILSALILCIAAGLIWKTHGSESAVSVSVIIAYILSNFAGGYLAGKKAEKHKFIWGIAVSVIYFTIIILAGVWFMDCRLSVNPQVVGNALICVVSGMFGGMFAPAK